jgi:hypothetical protein
MEFLKIKTMEGSPALLPVTGYQLPETSYRKPGTGNHLPVKRIALLLACCLLPAFLWAQAPATNPSNNLVIIVNKENPVKAMDKSEAKMYYLRIVKHSWPQTKAPIRPANYSGTSTVKDQFLKNVLRMNNERLISQFKQKEYAESLPMPPSFATEEEVVNYVANNLGAIGYISTEAFAKLGDRVKAVLVME